MKKILFLLPSLLISASLFATPAHCPYQPKDCSNLDDSSFWQSCYFSENPNTTALTEVRTSMIDEATQDKAMQVICMYDESNTPPSIGRVANATAIIHLNNKNEWHPEPHSPIPHVYHCTPSSASDCSFSVIN